MSTTLKRFVKGIVLRGESSDASENLEGSLFNNSVDQRIKAYIQGAVREVITNSQQQTLTNKTIDADNNTVSNLEVDNLKSGVLNTSTVLSGASNTQLPSALAVKTYVDNVAAAQNEASEITVSPSIGGFTATVQATLQGHQDLIDDLVTLSGVAANSENLGTFTGSTISDNSTVKTALQALETELELKADSSDLSTHVSASTNVHGIGAGSSVVGTTDTQELTNKTITGASIEEPIRSDVKQDTLANLITYATVATNGQIVYATDEKAMYQVVDGELVGIGGAGVVKLTAGENLSALDLVYISSGTGNDSGRTAERVYKVDASNDDRADVLGFVTKPITSGSIGEIQVSGNLKGFTGLTPGKVYYASASTPGAITATAPSADSQWVISVGLAASSSEIVINPVASASAIFLVDADKSFTLANNQSSATDVTGLLFDGAATRSFILDYSIYRQTDTALSAVAQVGQLRGVYNTQTSTWFMSDDFSGQNSGITFSILNSGQIRYTSTDISGTNYSGILKYTVRKSFGV